MMQNGQDPKPLPTTKLGRALLGIGLISTVVLIALAFEGPQDAAKYLVTSLF